MEYFNTLAFLPDRASYSIEPKSLSLGIKYGLILGISYWCINGVWVVLLTPIPLGLTFSWFIVGLVELTLAGLIVGLMVITFDKNEAWQIKLYRIKRC